MDTARVHDRVNGRVLGRVHGGATAVYTARIYTAVTMCASSMGVQELHHGELRHYSS